MKPRRTLAMTHCPNCGARIVPTPKELKQWRKVAGLTQRKIAARLKISAAHVAYLESGKRSPSATVIARYRKFIPQLRSATLPCSRLRAGIFRRPE
jgi:transcriptional regulator with XRE-family HTH domain